MIIIACWSTSVTAGLKSLSDNSTSLIILLLASTDCLSSFSLRSSWFFGMMGYFQLKAGHIHIMLWDSGSHLNLLRLLALSLLWQGKWRHCHNAAGQRWEFWLPTWSPLTPLHGRWGRWVWLSAGGDSCPGSLFGFLWLLPDGNAGFLLTASWG